MQEQKSPTFSLRRKFYQIYADFENIPFDAGKRTLATLRATILKNLAHFELVEYIPNKKRWDCSQRFEDIIKLSSPETEIKIGLGDYPTVLYIQVSCSNPKDFEAMFDHCKEILDSWAKGE